MKGFLKNIWYHLAKSYVAIGLYCYYKKITVIGRENIPKKGAVLFVANHQNALIDPLLITNTNKKNMYFLTRAGVFKKKFIAKIFDSFHMIPIYRVRDGWDSLAKNEAVFERCFDLLNDQNGLLIFPEGSHNVIRKVRPLSKGFTRILFGTYEKYPDLDIQIVPVGINYKSVANYPDSVSIYYGKPINSKQYWDKENIFESTNKIKEVVHAGMSELTAHISATGRYDEIAAKLDALNVDYLNPIETNKIIKNIDDYTVDTVKPSRSKKITNPLYYLVMLNSIISIVVWRNAQSKIKDLAFKSTFRYALTITLFPISYALQAVIISFIFDGSIGWIYFGLSLLSGFLLTKTLSLKN